MRRRRVPVRRSLVVRLLATSVLVAVCAIVATAWLAVQSTTRAIRQEQGRSLADDKSVYDTLLDYAATHRTWSGVEKVVAERAGKLNRRITLMTEDRQIIADSHPGPSLLSARPSATVDPLRVDLSLTGGTQRIDPRVVGPYKPTARQREELRRYAEFQVQCLNKLGIETKIVTGPDGSPTVQSDQINAVPLPAECPLADYGPRADVGAKPRKQLAERTARCLGISDKAVDISPDFTILVLEGRKIVAESPAYRRATTCLEKSRVEQLRPYAPPPALLFVTEPGNVAPEPVFNLSRTNAVRIATVTGAVLVVALLITVVVGRRLVRPLQALTEAARRPVDDQARVPVTTNDEIGYLATALNDLSERRAQAERLRKAMVSDVAHELRTPLTNIRSWLEAAQDGLAPADPQLLSLLLEEAVLLQHIIDDLRDLAAADAGSLRVHAEPCQIADLLAQVADAHRSAAETAGVRLRTEIHGDPAAVVDPVRLRQMVGNLVSNAVRHTPVGGRVTVSAGFDQQGLVIAVRDTGIGIAPDDLDKVFDRFWRADTSRTRATGGSGLGLAIARKLAEAHGGDITVASRLGAGTVFTIRLPTPALQHP
ncbi:sensor histidine kinase [Jidongwangia harbinensis]|uniref:sensor histidine kinase n=1 Tax=Jidongwangia harbinensis TaxID=2878561 RepID=UPI001CD937EB|nr:HAMP domain-containing sensor histidine kinase [Jidongwangia harbinensis]MCA2215337.1 HAMP domain-containing histidine kinase [Jidongwangia harbinensis]